MKRKIHFTRILLVIVTLLSMSSCVRDDLAAESQSQKNSKNMSAKFASRSLWKEDNVYINKVQQVFLKVANLEHVRTRYGELNWDYAMTFGNFNEAYALVPVIKDNKVVLLMEAVRTGHKVFFYEKDNKDLVDFFNLAIYSNVTKYDEVINKNGNISSKTLPAFVCTTRWLSIGCSDNEPNCVPYVKSITNCEYQGGTGIPPKTFDPIGMDGGGDGNNGYEYPEIPEEIDPCKKIKSQRSNVDFYSKINVLESDTGLKKETGFTQRVNGQYVYHDNASATNTNNSLSLPDPNLPENKNIKGFLHTHVDSYTYYDDFQQVDVTRTGIKILSPADIAYFMDLVKNALDEGRPLNDVYAGMIATIQNYQIRFTGNQYQIKTFTDEEAAAFRAPYTIFMQKSIDNQSKLELGFLQFLSEKMNLKGITLYRMNADGTNTEISLNDDKKSTNETNCPN
jgi:hypothetical protein